MQPEGLSRRAVRRRLRTLQGSDPFLTTEQLGSSGRADRASGSYRQGQRRGGRVVRRLVDDYHVVLAEGVAASEDLAPDCFEGRPNRFDPILRRIDLGGEGLRSVGGLVHVQRHVASPCREWLTAANRTPWWAPWISGLAEDSVGTGVLLSHTTTRLDPSRHKSRC